MESGISNNTNQQTMTQEKLYWCFLLQLCRSIYQFP